MRRDDTPSVKPVPGMRRVGSQCFPAAGQKAVAEDCCVVEEQALFLDVENVGLYTLM